MRCSPVAVSKRPDCGLWRFGGHHSQAAVAKTASAQQSFDGTAVRNAGHRFTRGGAPWDIGILRQRSLFLVMATQWFPLV